MALFNWLAFNLNCVLPRPKPQFITKILNNIFRVFNDRTIVFVTHKKQLIKYFDKVIKVDNGRVTTS